MDFYFDNSVSLDQNFTGDMNSFQNNSWTPFHNDAGNRSQFGYAGPPADTRMVSFVISLQPNALAQPVPQNTLRTASHADLLGAQNQAHTKLYEEYIALKHDVCAKA
jgi:hypothetical protein